MPFKEERIMHPHLRSTPFIVLLVLILVAPVAGLAITASAQGEDYRLTLPLAMLTGRIGKQPTILGGVLAAEDVTASVYTASQGGISWSRYNQYRWEAVESTEGERNWAGEAEAETRIAQMSAAGLTPIMVISGTPPWAQAVSGSSCGAITPDKLEAFGNFMFDLVSRFSHPPYNVEHYEFYDKPDIDPSNVMGDSSFGCWGDDDDSDYYGGDTYGEMLAAVYPRIKQANPNAQVLTGGLLLNCDYHYAYDPERDCEPSKFLAGILSTGAESFDIISYQAYSLRSDDRFDWERQYYLWQHRGGVVLGKLDFIREEFEAAEVPMKAVFLTEAGLTCWMEGGCADEMAELQADQANYVMRLYPRAQANGISALLWSTFSGPGWRETGILDADQNPRPAYRTFQLLGRVLGTSTYTGSEISQNGDMEAYTFTDSLGTVSTFYFSNSSATYTVTIPEGNVRLLDKYGNELPIPTNRELTVGFEPVLLQVEGAGR
jgi:hypothetical protein